MTKIKWLLVISLLLSAPTVSVADDTISFKDIKFGMNANQISSLGGGNIQKGCDSAINKLWTYGGIGDWTAHCVEDDEESYRVPGFSGMYMIRALVPDHNNLIVKMLKEQSYSVVEVANIFSKVFGKFEFVKNKAIATQKGAVAEISGDSSGGNASYIIIKITSLDYLAKNNEWKKQKDKKKANAAQADL